MVWFVFVVGFLIFLQALGRLDWFFTFWYLVHIFLVLFLREG